MSGMRGVFMGTDKGNEEQLRKRLEMVNWARSSNSLTFLDKDDQYNQYQLTATSGLAELMEKNMWLISAALEMQGILYGDLKGGLSQESDAFRRYAVTIQNRDNSYVRPVVHKFLTVVYIMNDIPGPVDFEFKSLIVKEQNVEKMEAIDKYVGLLSKLEEIGLISKYQTALSIKNMMENDVISINFTDERLKTLQIEEEYQLLDILKNSGKMGNSSREILRNQFGEETSLPDKINYMENVSENEEVGLKEEPEQQTEEVQEQNEETSQEE